jgi:hypothetical protein
MTKQESQFGTSLQLKDNKQVSRLNH